MFGFQAHLNDAAGALEEERSVAHFAMRVVGGLSSGMVYHVHVSCHFYRDLGRKRCDISLMPALNN